ncbi:MULTISPECIES: response regulator transcription factor [Serratia]|nr:MULTISPECIES: helix-turn-helix transcriptional regulator [Serratia]MBH2890482.1 helix-turn-helix transcriptional regulator [Serratia marcescens]MBN5392002.1 helix-turn-helix transcriptional regulator [Serratia marcescens]MCS4266532.1 DNA-binding CsgD family transcriptional regulator [Serratia sp. BIGb0163]
MALSTYFKSKNRKIKFILGRSMTEPADIIFQAIRCGTFIAPRSQYHANSGKSHYFAIVDNRDFHLQHLYRDLEKNNVFYRHQSVKTLLQLIEKKIFLSQSLPGKHPPEEQVFLREPLTLREHEVLCHLVQGKTHACAANCLGIKVKTISSHKRAAMKKLNFRRTNELFHWMLQGGLSRHQPIKGH